MNDHSNKPEQEKGEFRASSGVPDAPEAESPRLVIRGESIDTHPSPRIVTLRNSTSFIDFLGFTYFPDEPSTELYPLKEVLINIFNIPYFDWVPAKSGWQGYEKRIQLGAFGLVAFGGASQNNSIHVELAGHGCNQVKDWLLVNDWFETSDSRITRLDLAHDDFDGDVVNISNAIRWYEDDLFSSNGRPPSRHLHDDFDSGDGKTLNIGKRGNDRFTRIYEKGKQLGDPKSLWCRAEVEFKARTKIIPYEVFLYPDDYLAGAFKAFEYLSTEQSTFNSIEKDREISLERVTKQGKLACGRLVNLLCLLHNEDYKKVIDSLRRSGIPKSLEPLYKQGLLESGRFF
ncbi:MAG: replication initiation factor domain-containing protein [Gammaproteobacteria bacterium]|nr:replication initiation factor domain-containing protein [Gammaproteobacteria bacterium]